MQNAFDVPKEQFTHVKNGQESLLFRALPLQDGPSVEDTDEDALEAVIADPFSLQHDINHTEPADYQALFEEYCSSGAEIADDDSDDFCSPECLRPFDWRIKSWDGFYSLSDTNAKSLEFFLSERPIEVFDAFLQEMDPPGVLNIPTEKLIFSLYNLALGRQSLLFYFSDKRLAFVPTHEKVRAPGCSWSTIDGAIQVFSNCGSRLRRLRYTVAKIRERNKSPVLMAFADCIDLIVNRIERQMSGIELNMPLLALLEQVNRPARVIALLAGLLGCGDVSKPLSLNRLPTAKKLLDTLFERATDYENSDQHLFALTRMLLQRASEPWLCGLQDMVGLGNRQLFWRDVDYISSQPDAIIQTIDGSELVVTLDQSRIPHFLDWPLAVKALQTLNSFLVLSRYGDYETNAALNAQRKFHLEWCFNMSSLSELGKRIEQFQQQRSLPASTEPCDDIDMLKPTITDNFNSLLEAMDELPEKVEHAKAEHVEDDLDQICVAILNGTQVSSHHRHQIPMEVVFHESFHSIITIQHELANRLVLNIFTSDTNLNIVDHTCLLRQIYLLGSGVLSVGIEHTLFGDQGINMLGRDHARWPPLSTEINQTLSEVTEQAILSLGINKHVAGGGYLNFGIRNGCESSIPNLNGTDVLQLCYNIPPPLNLILTPAVIRLYDIVFTQLLRLLRTMYHLKGTTTRNHYARHFVWTWSHYISETVIPFHWKELTTVMGALKREPESVTLQQVIDVHSNVIRRIAEDSLLLNDQISTTVDEALQLVLTNQDVIPAVQSLVTELSDQSRHSSLRRTLLLGLNWSGFYKPT